MTVKELREKLQELDEDDECKVYMDTGSINAIYVDEIYYDPTQNIVLIF